MGVLEFDNDGFRGQDGTPGRDGSSGSYGGGRGQDGTRGEDGEDAGHAGTVDVTLRADDATIYVNGVMGSRPRYSGSNTNHTFTLGDPNAEVVMSAHGGRGGDGGRGGHGGRGGDGYPGANATRSSSGTNGGPGGNGGNGANGGNGGRGGNGANVTLYLHQIDMDLLMLIRQRIPATSGGRGGTGGHGGMGGSGGSGGPGGSSYSWSEPRTTYDANGNSTTVYDHYSNPGGYSGPNGSSGSSGHSGSDGNSGSSGVFGIMLTRESGMVERYPSAYDLQLHNVKYIDTVGYRVIEPASSVHLLVSHENVGGMPTPSHQFIRSYVNNNNWVTCMVEDRVPLRKWIEPGVTLEIDRPILYHVSDINGPARGEPFNATGYMEHSALVDRVNQDFGRIRKESTPFTIEYPAQASLIKGATAIAYGEEAPMVWNIWNKAVLGLGITATPSRILFSKFKVSLVAKGGTETLESVDLRLRDTNGNIFVDTASGLHADMPLLIPNDKLYFSSTLEFVNPDIKPYTRVSTEGHLFLGHVKDMHRPIHIQIRPFEVQLAEGYVRTPDADILLVVNNRTVYDEVQAWRNIARILGSHANVWNVNLYEDLCFNHVRKDGRTLFQDFNCGTIIFLNNHFLRDEKTDTPAVDFARSRELFVAARDHGINTLVYGSQDGFSMEQELIPSVNEKTTRLLFKSKDKLVSNMEKLMPPGEGSALAFPATAPASLCGVLMVNNKKRWVTLHLDSKTLCYYTSAKQHFPEGMVYLEKFSIVEGSGELDNPGATFQLVTVEKTFTVVVPEPSDYKGKHERYGSRQNYTQGASAWLNQLKPLATAGVSSSKPGSPPVEGFLKKHSHKSTSYNKRYFVLDPAQKTLFYYNGPKDTKPRGIVSLSRYSITEGNTFSAEQDSVDLKFQILTPVKTIYILTASVEEKTKWLQTLNEQVPPTEGFSIFRDQAVKMKEAAIRMRLSRSIDSSSSSFSSLPLETSKSKENDNVTQHNLVSVLPVENYYFIFKPKEKELEKKAKNLQKKLQARFPNQRNIVVYDFDATKSKRGFFLYHVGDLEVHRSLDATTTHMVHHVEPTDQASQDPAVIKSPRTMYSVLKTLEFARKLVILDTEIGLSKRTAFSVATAKDNENVSYLTSSDDTVTMAVFSIVSDICDEQNHFRQGKWKDGLDTQMIQTRLSKLERMKDFVFSSMKNHATPEERLDSLAGDILVEIGMHIEIMLECYPSFLDKAMPRRRCTYVTEATRKIWVEVLSNNLLDPVADPKKKPKMDPKLLETIKERVKAKRLAWRKYTVEAFPSGPNWGYIMKKDKVHKIKRKSVLAAYSHPPIIGAAYTDSSAKPKGYLSKQTFTSMIKPDRPSKVVEDKYLFKDNEARVQAIDNVQKELGCNPDEAALKRLPLVQDSVSGLASNNNNNNIPS